LYRFLTSLPNDFIYWSIFAWDKGVRGGGLKRNKFSKIVLIIRNNRIIINSERITLCYYLFSISEIRQFIRGSITSVNAFFRLLRKEGNGKSTKIIYVGVDWNILIINLTTLLLLIFLLTNSTCLKKQI
jgi:hypothetical protein